MEMGRDRFQTIIDASKKASQRGDLSQAERLLKSTLKQAERDMLNAEFALEEIVSSLAEIYELQGRCDQAKTLRDRYSQRDASQEGQLFKFEDNET